jgi:hypothetical protein
VRGDTGARLFGAPHASTVAPAALPPLPLRGAALAPHDDHPPLAAALWPRPQPQQRRLLPPAAPEWLQRVGDHAPRTELGSHGKGGGGGGGTVAARLPPGAPERHHGGAPTAASLHPLQHVPEPAEPAFAAAPALNPYGPQPARRGRGLGLASPERPPPPGLAVPLEQQQQQQRQQQQQGERERAAPSAAAAATAAARGREASAPFGTAASALELEEAIAQREAALLAANMDKAGVDAELAGLGPGAPRTLRERSRQAELQAQQVALERRLSELRLWLKAHAAV